MFWQNDKFSLDAFCVQPVIPSANSFASVNYEQLFTGFWGTYRPMRGEIVDLYYLNLDDVSHIYSGRSGVKGAMNLSTVGSRWYGDKNNWLWDTEAMLQFGSYSNQGILAKAYTMGGGYRFDKVAMTPQFWVYYDIASGDPDPGNNSVHRTFNQLFPFGHYYFGMTDLVGRQNINDIHADFAFFPTRWITAWRSIMYCGSTVPRTRCTTPPAWPLGRTSPGVRQRCGRGSHRDRQFHPRQTSERVRSVFAPVRGGLPAQDGQRSLTGVRVVDVQLPLVSRDVVCS